MQQRMLNHWLIFLAVTLLSPLFFYSCYSLPGDCLVFSGRVQMCQITQEAEVNIAVRKKLMIHRVNYMTFITNTLTYPASAFRLPIAIIENNENFDLIDSSRHTTSDETDEKLCCVHRLAFKK